MLARALLLGLLALASISSQAWATGPAYYPPGGSGSGVVANTCSAGDFFSAVDAGGNFTCSTPSGSGDVTAVGDCASGDCFSGSTGSTLTAAPAGHFVLKSSNSMYFDADIAAGSTGNAFVFRSNNTALTLARIVEDGYADLRSGLDLRLYDTDDSNYVEIAAPALGSNVSLTLPTSGGTIPSSATSPVTLSSAGVIALTQNAGTDVTADLEEETHASEHSLGGTDPITVTNLASSCTNAQVLGGTAGGTGVECQTDDDVPESGDFGALALTGDVSSSGLTTTIGADKITESMLKAVNGPTDEYILTYESTTGDFEWQNSIAATVTGAASLNTLLAGRSGSGNNTIISTDDNGQITLANSGASGSSKTGKLYGSGKTGENLLLQPNSANTTTGSVKVDGYLDFWPSIATNSSQVNVAGFSPTVTLSDGGGYSLIDSNPTLSIPDWSAIQIFRARGSIDRTGTTGGTLYQYTGFHMGTTFTSSTTGGPLFQDAFFDASVINQVANTATQNTYQPISFLSKPTYKASSGATLTIGQTTGVDINPSWGVGGGGTLTNTTFSAFKLHTPNEIGGTLSLPTYIALDVEDLDTAGVTTPLSLRSVGTTTEMRHAGAARFGATGAPTTGKDLDVQGDVLITGALDVGDAVADLPASSTTTIVDINDTINTPNSTGSLVGFGFNVISAQSESNNIIALDVQPTITQSGTSEVPMFYGLNIAGTTTATTANFPVAALLRHVRTYTSATANATPMTSLITLTNGPVVSNTATSGTTTVGTVESLYHNPTLSLNDTDGATSGVTAMTLTNDIAVEVAGTYTETSGTLTVTNRTGLKYSDVTNTGSNTAITNNVGVDIAALSTATTNIGIRNADTTVYTPCSQTSLTSGFTISPDCTVIEIGTSGNNNYTSSTSTGISAGVAGQILTLINVDSNSNTITMDNTGGTIELAGAADYAMGINDTLTLVYSATRSLWLETARSDN